MTALEFITTHWVVTGGFATMLYYGVKAYFKKKLHPDKLADVLAVLIGGLSFLTGIDIFIQIVKKINKSQVPLTMESEAGYMLVGGIAIIWLAGVELNKKFSDLNNP